MTGWFGIAEPEDVIDADEAVVALRRAGWRVLARYKANETFTSPIVSKLPASARIGDRLIYEVSKYPRLVVLLLYDP